MRCVLLLVLVLALGAVETRPLRLHEQLVLQVPTAWEPQPDAGMAVAKLRIPAAGGEDGELSAFDFGARGAGDVEANMQRWIGMFAEDGRAVERATGTAQHGEYHLVQITGTYQKPVGPPMGGRKEPRADWAMLAVVLPGPQGPFYLRLTGPRDFALAQRAALEAAIRAP